MTDVALRGAALEASEVPSRTAVLQRLRLRDAMFRTLTRSAALMVLLLLGGVILSLIIGSGHRALHAAAHRAPDRVRPWLPQSPTKGSTPGADAATAS